MPTFQDIPQFPRAHYEIDVEWGYLERHLEDWGERDGINLDPDYQRVHVWTKEQQRAYVQYMLMGGEVGRVLTWNCTTWGTTFSTPIELVDGKQRLEAVRAFLRDDLTVFGHVRSEYSGSIRIIQGGFKFRVCRLQTRAEVLQLYLNINAGGTPHTPEELNRVRTLLAQE